MEELWAPEWEAIISMIPVFYKGLSCQKEEDMCYAFLKFIFQ